MTYNVQLEFQIHPISFDWNFKNLIWVSETLVEIIKLQNANFKWSYLISMEILDISNQRSRYKFYNVQLNFKDVKWNIAKWTIYPTCSHIPIAL